MLPDAVCKEVPIAIDTLKELNVIGLFIYLFYFECFGG